MKFLFNSDVYGWRMTGIIPTGGGWFLGFSRSTSATAVRWDDLERAISAARDLLNAEAALQDARGFMPQKLAREDVTAAKEALAEVVLRHSISPK